MQFLLSHIHICEIIKCKHESRVNRQFVWLVVIVCVLTLIIVVVALVGLSSIVFSM